MEATAIELVVMKRTGGLETMEAASETTFSELAKLYLEWTQLNKAKRTYDNERGLLNKNLLPYFGDMTLDAVSVRAIERYKLKRQRDGVSNRTINIELQIVSVMFRRAIEWEFVVANPMARVKRLKEAKKPPRYLSIDETQRLLEAARKTYLYPLVICGLCTGMRKQELFQLQWRDVDFDANTITVRSTKDNDYRTLEMTDNLRQALSAELRTAQASYGQAIRTKHVFTYDGEPLRWTCDKTFKTICRNAQVENCTLHTLRHTFASHLVIEGVSLAHVQRLMGHSDYSTTLIYAHLSSESHKGHVHKLPFGSRAKGDA